jgi:hypothetical protein
MPGKAAIEPSLPGCTPSSSARKDHLIAFATVAFISMLARRLNCLVAEDLSA